MAGHKKDDASSKMVNGNPQPRTVARSGEVGLEFAFEAYGLRIGIQLNDPDLLSLVSARFPPGWAPVEPIDLDRSYRIEPVDREQAGFPQRSVRLMADDVFAAWAPSVELLGEALESQLQIYVAEFAHPHLFVHAGVVAWHGSVIVIPGKSFSGKSTLVAALVDAGATYYSDEYAVLDSTGRVSPYPRLVSLRDGPHGPAGRLDFSNRGPQRDLTTRPIPIDLVLLTRYEPGASWRCDLLEGGSAIMAMCEHTVAIQNRPAETLSILSKVAESAHVYKGVRGEMGTAVNLIQQFIHKHIEESRSPAELLVGSDPVGKGMV